MKYNKTKIKWLALASMFIALAFASCQTDDDLGQADRLFRPIINETSYGGTWIRLVWDKYEGVENYQLQLSTDSFATFVAEVETDTTFYRFENLEYDTDYYVRIKSIGNELESRYFEHEVIRTFDYPTRLNNLTADDVIDTQARISWLEVNYDSLVVLSADTVFKTVELTDVNNQNKQVIIRALEPSSSYKVLAYKDGDYQGKKSFSTIASQVIVGEILDLRGYSDEESYSLLNQSFFDQLAVDYPDGVTVILSGGTKYELGGTIYLKSPLNLVTGYSLNGKAIIEVNGNYNLEAGKLISNLYFEKLAFTEHAGSPKTASNYGGRYIFNMNGAGSSIDSLEFEDCDIRYKRGVVRIQTAANLKAISVNNCYMDSIAGYGVVNYDNAGVTGTSISVTNSTFSHTELFIRTDRMTTALESITVSNVTFALAPKDIVLRNGTVNSMTITKCLFGPSQTGNPLTGMSKTAASSLILDNYQTADCVWLATAIAIDATLMTKTGAEIFGDITNNDYTVTESSLKDRIGDPRWW